MIERLVPLRQAVSAHVRPGMHLNFASTPSRSNASIREVARQFKGTDPGFTLSSTGFHSTAHLLALLRLGSRYIACFFGDNYPVPRPNGLYQSLLAEGKRLEHWSLWSYVSALRAGALGHPYAVTRSLAGTTLGAELAADGHFTVVRDHPADTEEVGLVRAMRSDITFVHTLACDVYGNAISSAPYSEGFWGALGARTGVIVTTERIVEPAVVERHADAIKIPVHRVLAVSEAPFGAHPQPVFAAPSLDTDPALSGLGYRDDFEHYEAWRSMSKDEARFNEFVSSVLEAPDPEGAYRLFVGEDRVRGLRTPPPRRATSPDAGDAPASTDERLAILAARVIMDRVRTEGYQVLLAGIGHAFFAARLARLNLASAGVEVRVMVETGLFDLECGPDADEFLLSYANIAGALRLTSVEDILGTLACGASNRCLGIIGAAQVDALGNVNSTRLDDGRLLVGSGGANDIASSAAETIVVTTCERTRLVARASYITSPGRGVRRVVTERCTFGREDAEGSWSVRDVASIDGNGDIKSAIEDVRSRCAWGLAISGNTHFGAPVSVAELKLLRSIQPPGLRSRRD